jgi:hypothetical protein
MSETKPWAGTGRRSAIHTRSIGTTGGRAPAPAGMAGAYRLSPGVPVAWHRECRCGSDRAPA